TVDSSGLMTSPGTLIAPIHRFIFLTLIAGACACASAMPQLPVDSGSASEIFFSSTDSVFQVGEELTYNVSYASFDLGQVRILLTDRSVREGITYYRAITYIDSYKGVPLVSLHAVYEDTID